MNLRTSARIWHNIGILVLMVVSMLLDREARASFRMPTVERAVIHSPNGLYEFTLDPSDRNGAGTSQVTIRIDGKQSWEGPLPFTFWKAEATEDGVLIGYGYTDGYTPPNRAKDNPGSGSAASEIVAAALNAEGQILAEHRHPRQQVLVLDVPPKTVVRACAIDREGTRMALVMEDPKYDPALAVTWIVPLKDNEKPYEFMPLAKRAPGQNPFLDAVVPLGGTPLLIIDYRTLGADWRETVHHLALVESNGDALWEWTGKPMKPTRGGCLVDKPQDDRRFTVQNGDEKEEIVFEALQTGDKWMVQEVDRRSPADQPTTQPANKADQATTSTDFPTMAPDILGTIRLKYTPEEESPIRIGSAPRSFAIDEQGRFAFIQRGPKLTILAPDGKIAKEVELKRLADEKRYPQHHLGSAGDGIFVVPVAAPTATSREGPPNPCVINSETGEVTVHDAIKLWGVYSMAAGHGMFVYTGWKDADINKGDIVAVHKVSGELLWSIDQLDTGTKHRLFSPEDVAVTSDGRIALLCKFPDAVYLFDAGGARVATWNLETAWGRKPNYVASLIADHSGAIIVEDFHGHPSFVRMTAEGRRAEQFDLPTRWAIADPFGSLWYSDEYTLRRLGADLKPDRLLGHLPSSEEIGDLAASAIGNDGTVYLMARRTNLIHVFGPDGTKLRVIHPAMEDTPGQSDSGRTYTLTPLGDGTVALTLPPRVSIFGPGGERLKSMVYTLTSHAPKLVPQPGTGYCWSLEYQAIRLLDVNGGVSKQLDRRSDGRWITHPHQPLVGLDGSLQVFDGEDAGDGLAHTFTPDGAARSSFRIRPPMGPYHPSAFKRDLLVTATMDLISALHEDGTPAFQIKVAHPDGKQVLWHPYFVAGGRELWLYDGADVIVKVRTP